MKKIIILFIVLVIPYFALCNERVGEIFINRIDVFDSTKSDWFFAAPLANKLHALTKEYIIEDELLFSEKDDLDFELLSETARNLRSTGLFTEVKIMLDSVNEYIYNVIIITWDRWSTYPAFLFGKGGGNTSIGGRLSELNFLGTGTQIHVETLNRSENNIGWQTAAALYQRRLFRTDFALNTYFMHNQYRDWQILSIDKPYRTISSELSYGAYGSNNIGKDFIYWKSDSTAIVPTHEKTVSAYFSRAWMKKDRVFATIYTELQDVDRGGKMYRRAFDNSGKILIAFSSVSQDFLITNKLNTYQTEDMTVGGWGSAIIGKTFSLGSKGENLYYVAGQGERSTMRENLYLFGRAMGSSGFDQNYGKYTYQEFYGLGFYRLNKELLIGGRVRQQSVWNWNAARQLILDNDAGLRGYSANRLTGDNRMVGNLEMRYFTDFPLWIFNFSGVLFWDIGSVWNQGTEIMKAKFHNSAGFGIRLHDTKATGPSGIYRFDFAFNFDKMKFAEIIFSTDQLFSVFAKHEFKLPAMYGTEFDNE
ncbi:MAG: Bac surface Ag protein [Ignavibacteria bacterium]|nr:Bac surface Ag protein [Ignavibacteria bacterium]